MDAAERGHADGSADLPAIVFAPARPECSRPRGPNVRADRVAAGVAAGGVVAYGVGDIGGAAKSVWHGITSLF